MTQCIYYDYCCYVLSDPVVVINTAKSFVAIFIRQLTHYHPLKETVSIYRVN